jgi:hypothetical protein
MASERPCASSAALRSRLYSSRGAVKGLLVNTETASAYNRAAAANCSDNFRFIS